jgi:formylglycine-generating enzyme required for sulfatase activity
MYPSTTYPATVSDFRLDRFEVTLGRFRLFVDAGGGTQDNPPSAGTGAHPHIPSSGWDASWSANLAPDTATLVTNLVPWTDAPGPDDDRPIGNITWYEAMAFCAWDEGYLPSEAEWAYAASGGSAQRAYPWSSPASSTALDCTEANYGGSDYPNTACAPTGTRAVGSTSPSGDAAWGQSDMGGNALEWVLDWFADYAVPCNDCADLVPGSTRVLRGGDLADVATALRNGYRRGDVAPSARFGGVGVRCARNP